MLKNLVKGMFQRRQPAPVVESAAQAAEPSLQQALVLFRQRDYDAPIAECERIIARDPVNSRAWGMLGVIAMERGDKHLARERFETALRAGGDQLEALCNAAEANRQAGHGTRALELAARVLALQPGHWQAPHIQAPAYQSCWRMDDAFVVFRRLAEQKPEFSRAHASCMILLLVLIAPRHARAPVVLNIRRFVDALAQLCRMARAQRYTRGMKDGAC